MHYVYIWFYFPFTSFLFIYIFFMIFIHLWYFEITFCANNQIYADILKNQYTLSDPTAEIDKLLLIKTKKA